MSKSASSPNVARSTRHPAIAGQFFEHLVLYFLSRNGFESTIVDHTGIDILARSPYDQKLMGVSVKGRTRNDGESAGRIKINNIEAHGDKIRAACKAFGNAVPYLAILVDARDVMTCALTPLEHVLKNTLPLAETSIGI